MAITDGTAARGAACRRAGAARWPPDRRRDRSPRSSRTARWPASVITMDRAFRMLVRAAGLSLHEAARLCATTPAAQLGLTDRGPARTRASARTSSSSAAARVVRDVDRRPPGARNTDTRPLRLLSPGDPMSSLPSPLDVAQPSSAAVPGAAGCEVNLNTEGLTVREKRTFAVTGQPRHHARDLRRRHRNPLVGSQRSGGGDREARRWSRRSSTQMTVEAAAGRRPHVAARQGARGGREIARTHRGRAHLACRAPAASPCRAGA